MKTGKIKILNCEISAISINDLLFNLKNGILLTPNIDHLVKLQKDKEFHFIYKSAEWVVCDSKLIYIFSKLLKKSIPEPIPGSSFFPLFYQYHKDNINCKIFILGAKHGVAQKAMDNINKKIGRSIIVGAHSPSFGFENNTEENNLICDIINNSGANVVLVGLGAPKQEKWIHSYKEKMPNIELWLALGATIDFEAGNIKRAPILLQKMGLEWFYRFIKEPRRLFKRYFIEDIVFFWYFGKQLLGLYKDPFK